MADIYLIRHGKTIGNMQKRYVGSTDEPLCETGISELNARREIILRAFSMSDGHGGQRDISVENEHGGQQDISAENEHGGQRNRRTETERGKLPETVYVSPMIRCRQTADILFPDAKQEIIPDFREMDFGQFEYKNYAELADDARYQAFIDSGGCLDFPEAEPQQQFRKRVRKAFSQCLEKQETSMAGLASGDPQEPLVFVVHGGTIMAIMEKFARPHRGYFEWQVGAGCGYRCMLRCEGDGFYLDHVMEISRAIGTDRSI